MGRVGATNVVVLEVAAIAGRAGLGMGALVETRSDVCVCVIFEQEATFWSLTKASF